MAFFLVVSEKCPTFANWLKNGIIMRQLKISKSITNRESASLEKYLQEIGKEEMLTAEEEVELAQRIRNGDQKALERLTRANLRFVVSMRHGDLSSSPMLYGGSVRASCRPSPSRAVSSDCRSIRSVPSIRSIGRSTSSSRRTSVAPLWKR